MKNKAKIISFLLAFIPVLGNSNFATSVVAETHTHNYINKHCECGSYLFEAEEGIIKGTNSSSGSTDGFVAEATSNNASHPTSNGKVVRNWGVIGNTITWKFNLNKEQKDTNIRLWVGAKSSDLKTSNLSISVNGVNATWKNNSVNTIGNYMFYFVGTEATLSFPKGNNELTIKNNSNINWNIDCLELEFDSSTSVNSFVDGEPLGTLDSEDGGSTSYASSIKIEAEYATKIEGTIGNGSPSFLEEDDECSNGGCIANWGNEGDNIVTFKFESSNEVNSAIVKIAVAGSNEGVEYANTIIPRINGGSGGAAPFNRYPDVYGIDITSAGTWGAFNGWYSFVEISTPSIKLNKGTNTFELESFNGYSVNIDYIIIETSENTNFSYTNVDHGVGGKGGPITLEAESAIIKGTSSDALGVDGMILDRQSSNPSVHETSGGKCVGNFGTVNNSITWTFKSNVDVSSFKLSLWVASAFSGGNINDVLSFKINGVEATFDQSLFPSYPGNDKWYNWEELTISNASINKGVNKIILTNISGSSFNIDCIHLEVPTSCIIRVDNIDVTSPTIGIIYFTSNVFETYEDLEFTFEYEDDITEKEKLSISVKVYFEFGTSKQETVTSTNNKFKPTKIGTYTIIVTVKDEANNETSRKRNVVVAKEGKNKPNTPIIPDNPNGGVNVHNINKRVLGGWLTFAISLLISGGLIGYMVYKNKKRI